MNALQMQTILDHAPVGTVIGMRPAPTFNLFRKFVSWQIQRYQKRLFPRASRVSPAAVEITHVLQYLGAGEVWEFTAPRARRIRLDQVAGEVYGFAVPVRLVPMDPDLVRRRWLAVEGKEYDYLDLMDFLLYEVLRYPRATTPFFSGLLGLGKDRFVCSTMIAAVFREFGRDRGIYNLLPSVPVELTTPAHFFLSPADFDCHLLYNL